MLREQFSDKVTIGIYCSPRDYTAVNGQNSNGVNYTFDKTPDPVIKIRSPGSEYPYAAWIGR